MLLLMQDKFALLHQNHAPYLHLLSTAEHYGFLQHSPMSGGPHTWSADARIPSFVPNVSDKHLYGTDTGDTVSAHRPCPDSLSEGYMARRHHTFQLFPAYIFPLYVKPLPGLSPTVGKHATRKVAFAKKRHINKRHPAGIEAEHEHITCKCQIRFI